MLRILGSPKTLCGGMNRRDWLRIGGLGLAGLSLPDVLHLQSVAAAEGKNREPGFGRAKAIILIHLYGSPSQLEWLDPKPDAPVEVRGQFGVIPSSIPGCQVCDLFPKMAKVLDRTTVIRSLTHPYPLHGVAYALTGVPAIDVAMELAPHDARHWPFFGSVVEYIAAQAAGSSSPPTANALSAAANALRRVPGEPSPSATPNHRLPNNIALPFRLSTQRVGEVHRAGPYAAFLGSQYDPLWADFRGQATRGITKTLRDIVFTDPDPYIGIADNSYFIVPNASQLQPELTLDRLNTRRSLVSQLNSNLPRLVESTSAQAMNKHQAAALSLLESPQLAEALDLRREPQHIRQLYGDNLFGQSCLAARRLVEAGSKVVTVFWDEFGVAASGWDTHYNHFERMKVELAPGLDIGWHGLITDLEQRGLLDDVLVVCTSEHGRTPKVSQANGGGRDHWARAYSSIVAGGGTTRGKVVGATDKQAGDVADRPVSPKDLLATMYHLLGIDHRTLLHDRQNRPLPLVEGNILNDIIA